MNSFSELLAALLRLGKDLGKDLEEHASRALKQEIEIAHAEAILEDDRRWLKSINARWEGE